MVKPNLSGWRKDPFIENERYHVARLAKLPISANNSDLLPLVGNQDNIGACVGFTVAELCHSEAVKDGIAAKKSKISFSPWWFYNGARYYIGRLNEDFGCYPKDAFRWMEEYGFMFWDQWPFTLIDGWAPLDKTDPTTRAADAVTYAKLSKLRIDNGVDGILDALASRYCVAIGAPWPKNWSSGQEDVQPRITDSTEFGGGHGYLLHSYNSNGLIEAMNHWTDQWGQIIPFLGTRGGFKFHMEDIEAFKKYSYGYDAYRIDVEMQDGPRPKPDIQHCSCSKIIADILNSIGRKTGLAHGRFYYR